MALSSANATVVIDNLSVTVRDDSEIADSNFTAQPAYWAAQAFTTDNQQYSLDSIQARVGNRSGDPNIVARLHEYTATNEIGSLLLSFTGETIDVAFAPKTFAPNSSFSLAPNTSYWIVIGVSGTGRFEWSYADPLDALVFNGPGSVPPTNSFADSDDSGSTWRYYELGAFEGSGAYLFRVNGTAAIPEPASGMSLLLIAGWISVRFRNRSQSSHGG